MGLQKKVDHPLERTLYEYTDYDTLCALLEATFLCLVPLEFGFYFHETPQGYE